MSYKVCSKCRNEKKISKFSPSKANKDGLHSWCKSCRNELQREYYSRNKNKQKNWQFIKSYGISLEEYNQMFIEQDGCCAICGTHQSYLNKPLYIDHDHITNKIRKLLCHNCNCLLGFCLDDTEILNRAIEYLYAHRHS
jgi:hypothetical protein